MGGSRERGTTACSPAVDVRAEQPQVPTCRGSAADKAEIAMAEMRGL